MGELVPADPNIAGPIIGTLNPPEVDYSPVQAIGAAVRQESPIWGALDNWTSPHFTADPNFDVLDAIEKTPNGARNADKLARATSRIEFDFLVSKLEKEERDNAILNSYGVAGIALRSAAGLLSPSTLAPLVGPARGLKGIAQSFALAGAAVAGDELTLAVLQDTRTSEEVATGIALGTLIGGVLGSSVKYFDTRARARAGLEPYDTPNVETILHADETGATNRIELVPTRLEDYPRVTAKLEAYTSAQPEPRGLQEGETFVVFNNEGKPFLVTRQLEGPASPLLAVRGEDGRVSYLGVGLHQRSIYDKDFQLTAREGQLLREVPSGELVPLAASYAREIQTNAQTGRLSESLVLERNAILAEATRRSRIRPQDKVNFPELESLAREWGNRPLGQPEIPVKEFKLPEDQLQITSRPIDAELPNRGSVGAAAVKAERGLAKGPNIVTRVAINQLAKLNPVTRLLNNKYFASARSFTAQLQLPGVRLTDNVDLQPETFAGAAYDRALVHMAVLKPLIETLDLAYASHFTGRALAPTETSRIFAAQLKGRAGIGLPPGKMSRIEFMTEAFRIANTGQKVDDPFLEMAKEAQLKYYNYVSDVAKKYYEYRKTIDGEDARPLWDDLEFGPESKIQHYIHHVFDANKVIDQLDQFLEDVSKNIQDGMKNQFVKSHKGYVARNAKLNEWETILMLDGEGLDRAYADTVAERDALRAQFEGPLKQVVAYRKSLRESGQSAGEAEEAVRAMEKQFGPEYAEAMRRIKELEARRKRLDQAGAGLTDRQQATLDRLDRLEDLQIKELERVIAKGARFRKQFEKLDPEVHREKMNTTWQNYKKAVHRFIVRANKVQDLLDRGNFPGAVEQGILTNKGRERMDNLFARFEDLRDFDPEAAQQLVLEAQQEYLERINLLQNKRALRGEELKKKAKEQDPAARAEWRTKELEATRQARDELRDSFREGWRNRGADEIDLVEGTASFKDAADNAAQDIYRSITGNPLRVAGLDVIAAERGAELKRMLNLPLEEKMKYLETDPEKIARIHAHHIFPDMELYRLTGSVNAKPWFDRLDADTKVGLDAIKNATHLLGGVVVRDRVIKLGTPINANNFTPEGLAELSKGQKLVKLTDARRKRLNKEFTEESQQVKRDLGVLIDRMRHSRGIPEDPNGFGYRLGRAALNANVARYMGSVVPSSLPDFARPIFYHGLTRTFNDAWLPLITDMKRFKAVQQEGYLSAIGLDPILHNRAHQMMDIGTNYASRATAPERALEFFANKTGLIALFDRYTAFQKQVSSNLIYSVLASDFKALFEGGSKKAVTEALDRFHYANISDDMIKRIWRQYNKEGGSEVFNGGFRLPNTGNWDDFEAVMAIRSMVNKLADDAIVTPGLDRPSWFDQNMAFRNMSQFRSFSFTATNRIIMSGLQAPDMALMQGVLFSVALGALSYYTWAVSKGGDAYDRMQDASDEQWIYEAIARSGVLGVFNEAQRIGEQIPLLNDWSIFGGEGRATRRASSLLGTVFGPSFDLAERLANIVQGIDEPTQSTLHQGRVIVPYQNLFFFRQALDVVEESTADLLGLPEERRR